MILAVNPSLHLCYNHINWCKTLHCSKILECLGYNQSEVWFNGRLKRRAQHCDFGYKPCTTSFNLLQLHHLIQDTSLQQKIQSVQVAINYQRWLNGGFKKRMENAIPAPRVIKLPWWMDVSHDPHGPHGNTMPWCKARATNVMCTITKE